MRRDRLIYFILLFVAIIGFWWFENFYNPESYSSGDDRVGGVPFETEILPKDSGNEVVVHDHYMLSYSEPHEQAEWVAYTLKRSHLTYDDRERPYFIEDPKVKSKSADWKNYKRSGYDRGHLCPAGDRRFSEYAYNQTFYTSNITPQKKDFNAGVWNRLEIQVRQWCKKYGTLHIITAGVLSGNMEEIGTEDVDVPNSFYKIVLRKENGFYRALAFLIPHYESQKPLSDFVVSIDELERSTGLDFFNSLDDETETQLEQTKELSGWDF